MAKWNAYYFRLVLVAFWCLFAIVGHLLETFNILGFFPGSSTILIISLFSCHEFFPFFHPLRLGVPQDPKLTLRSFPLVCFPVFLSCAI